MPRRRAIGAEPDLPARVQVGARHMVDLRCLDERSTSSAVTRSCRLRSRTPFPPGASIRYAMTSIALAGDGSINVSFGNGTAINADHVILSMSFSVLRTLSYKKAGFDSLKETAITQLGSGLNVKLMLQFDSRIWNSYGSTGSLYSDRPFTSGWEVTRGQSGSTGILVEYPGADQRSRWVSRAPIRRTRRTRTLRHTHNSSYRRSSRSFPGSPPGGTAKRCYRRPRRIRTSSARTRTGSRGSTPVSAGREEAAGEHPLRRGALFDGLPGLHGGRRLRGRARRERDLVRSKQSLKPNLAFGRGVSPLRRGRRMGALNTRPLRSSQGT